MLDHGGASVWGASLDPSGQRLATAAEDGKVRIWDLASAAPIREIAAHDGDAVQVSFAAGGARLITSGNDGRLRVWDSATGERLSELADLERGRFSALGGGDLSRPAFSSSRQEGRLPGAAKNGLMHG